jgi:hypothetical protein
MMIFTLLILAFVCRFLYTLGKNSEKAEGKIFFYSFSLMAGLLLSSISYNLIS